MRIHIRLIALICLLLVNPATVFAEQDIRELILQLAHKIDQLQTQVTQSNARIDELEQQIKNTAAQQSSNAHSIIAQPKVISPSPLQAEKPSKPQVTAGDIKGTIKIPGTDTSIGMGGFAKLDTLFNSTSMGKDKLGNQRLEVAEIPVGNIPPGDSDQFSIHAKESRFWLKSFTPSQWGDMNTYLELDFLGDAGTYTYTPRLRHAYGSLGNLLAGQTWSTFFNSQALADTLDNNNSAGALLALRQPQIRWTQPFSLGKLPMEWQLSAEAPRTRVWDAAGAGMSTVSANHYPDMVARLNFNPDWGNISLAALGRHLQYTPSVLNTEKSAWGGAVSIAGKASTFGSDNIRFMLSYGDALGRYAVNNFFEDGAVNSAGEFNAVSSYSGVLAYQHWWNQAWRSTIAYGFARADQPGFASSANQQAQSLHANLLWSPMLQTTIGLEYIYANRELVNGQNGELQRVQFSTRFNY